MVEKKQRIAMKFIATLLSLIPAATFALQPAYYPQGGATYFTTHATTSPLPGASHFNEALKDPAIKEFHL